MTKVVTRFAPSPTGFLHIGGARTALFNWLYAKRFGGQFLLRIEDTDRERSTKAAVDAIIDGLDWLGLKWDGEAISQFERADRHREVAEQLLASGGAYRCYASQDELEAMRAQARLEGKPMRYDGRWRDRDPSAGAAGRQAGDPPARAPGRRDDRRGQGAGQGHLRQQGARRSRAAALGRQSDLYARRRRRRPRHGRHPCHPRRRSSDQRRAADADLRRARLGRACHGAYSADPWAGRRQALQASRRARRRRLSRARLSARRAAQLSRAARLEPGRPRVLLDRGSDRGVRSARDRPFALALRLRQAREHERPFHARDARRRIARSADRRPALSARRPRDRRQARRGQARPARRARCPA